MQIPVRLLLAAKIFGDFVATLTQHFSLGYELINL
jgi:hypothetical protein